MPSNFTDIRDREECHHVCHSHNFYYVDNDVMFCTWCNVPVLFYYSGCPRFASHDTLVRDDGFVVCVDCDFEQEIPNPMEPEAKYRRREKAADWLNLRHIKPDSWLNHSAAEGTGADVGWCVPQYQRDRLERSQIGVKNNG